MQLGPYELNTIVTGDARELSKAIPDESVDLIFTDPMYDRLDDYRWLAETALRILKPDSALLVWLGIGYLPEVINALATFLSFRWQLIDRRLGQRPDPFLGWGFTKYAPCLWFEKGKSKLSTPTVDLLESITVGGMNFNHQWTKNPRASHDWIEDFTKPDSMIFDPFTGGGTVPAVCKMLGRNYLAFEIDPDTAERARERVANTQPPLFVMPPEQLTLDTRPV